MYTMRLGNRVIWANPMSGPGLALFPIWFLSHINWLLDPKQKAEHCSCQYAAPCAVLHRSSYWELNTENDKSSSKFLVCAFNKTCQNSLAQKYIINLQIKHCNSQTPKYRESNAHAHTYRNPIAGKITEKADSWKWIEALQTCLM